MCYFGFLTGSLYPRYPKFCVFISNMTENLGCLLHRQLEDVSRIVFSIIQDFYNEAAPTAVKTAAVVSYQSYGDLVRWNPHYHCLVLEGGIDETGSFYHIPIKDTSRLTEVFRRRVIKLFVDKGLLDRSFALKILSWKHSGFSVDNSVTIPAYSNKARVNLSQYIIRHPVSLQKILYARSNGTIIYKRKYNEYFKENIKLFKASDFIARLYRRVHPARPAKAQAPWQSSRLHAIMGCIPAGRKVRPSKMGALQNSVISLMLLRM